METLWWKVAMSLLLRPYSQAMRGMPYDQAWSSVRRWWLYMPQLLRQGPYTPPTPCGWWWDQARMLPRLQATGECTLIDKYICAISEKPYPNLENGGKCEGCTRCGITLSSRWLNDPQKVGHKACLTCYDKFIRHLSTADKTCPVCLHLYGHKTVIGRGTDLERCGTCNNLIGPKTLKSLQELPEYQNVLSLKDQAIRPDVLKCENVIINGTCYFI